MSKNNSYVEQLMGIKGGANNLHFNEERDRFKMPHSADTSVRDDLNANRIVIDGKNIAIATQYPLDHQVEAQLQMLLDNRTPVLVILASITDIQNHQLAEYFSGAKTLGDIETNSKFVDYIDLSNDIEAKLFNLSITSKEASIEVPVIHVFNWPDYKTVSLETTTKLVELIETKLAESQAASDANQDPALIDPEKILPVMHCKAGVGRTGQTLAAIAIKRNPEMSLESITKDLRHSRNDRMIQTPYQMETLVEMMGGAQPVELKPEKSSGGFFGKLFGRG